MKKLFIIANWKSNKTIKETEEWLHSFSEGFSREGVKVEGKKIITAPSFTCLEHARYCLVNLKLSLKFAAQDISPFGEGSYTGEVNGKQIKELVDYVIVGHSERRSNFYENNEMINKKLSMSRRHGLTPILCVSNLKQIHDSKFIIHNSNSIVAYEPLFAIGSGNPDTPENADVMAKNIKKELGGIPVLYGGSVSPENVRSFTQMSNIDGVLVGGASLDPHRFLEIIKNA